MEAHVSIDNFCFLHADPLERRKYALEWLGGKSRQQKREMNNKNKYDLTVLFIQKCISGGDNELGARVGRNDNRQRRVTSTCLACRIGFASKRGL